jgi:hypothetical protein
VLQNEKYIAFADDNTVEVLALQRMDEAQKKEPNDRRLETYDAKDENGNPVKYMKEFAGMTADQILAMNGSGAGQFNKSGHIPYVSVVDPFTLKEIKGDATKQGVGGLEEAVLEAKKALNAEHGPSVKRSVLWKAQAGVKSVEATLAKDGPAKALPEACKLETSVAKEPEAIKAMATAEKEKVLEAVKTQLDAAEQKIGSGDMKGAKSILSPLVGVLKGTDYEARAKELLEKTKAVPEPAK